MKHFNLLIAGIPCKFIIHQIPGAKKLIEEIGLYPITEETVRVIFNYVSFDHFQNLLQQTDQKKIIWNSKFKNSQIALVDGQHPMVYFCIVPHRNIFYKTMQKLTSNQFTIREEYVGQIFHENVLIPVLVHLKDVLLIHGASFVMNGKSFLIGGRGGVGKTSIELRSCYHNKALFITDDMAVIYQQRIFPNLNYPKIYKYNLVGERELKSTLLKSFSPLRLIHWALFPVFFNKQPRIRINPKLLYAVGGGASLDFYLVIERVIEDNFFEFKRINNEKAREITIGIMKEELHQFNVSENYFKDYGSLFDKQMNGTDIYLLKISQGLNHQEYLRKMDEIVQSLSR